VRLDRLTAPHDRIRVVSLGSLDTLSGAV
jgi:hypothetical protein